MWATLLVAALMMRTSRTNALDMPSKKSSWLRYPLVQRDGRIMPSTMIQGSSNASRMEVAGSLIVGDNDLEGFVQHMFGISKNESSLFGESLHNIFVSDECVSLIVLCSQSKGYLSYAAQWIRLRQRLATCC
jgi:hypothetical protein